MSSIAPIRTIRVIGTVDKFGNVNPSREFTLWLEQQSRVITGEVSAPVFSGVDPLTPVSGGIDWAAMADMGPVAGMVAAADDFAPVAGADVVTDIWPVAGACPDMAGLEPV